MSGMEPMAILAIAGAVGGTAMSVTGREMQGQEQSRAAAFEQEQLKTQEQMTRTAAAQSEAHRRDELTSSMETIQAIRAGRGVGMASPTGQAILQHTADVGESDIQAERTTYLTRADNSRMSAEMAGRRRRMSLVAADIGAAGDIFSGVSRAASIGMTRGR